MLQIMRELTAPHGMLGGKRLFLCDHDRKWSLAVRQLLERSGVWVIQTPFRAPNCNAHTERFVRSIKEECLKRVVPIGEQHFRQTVAAYVVHYRSGTNTDGRGDRRCRGHYTVKPRVDCGLLPEVAVTDSSSLNDD